MSIIHIDVTAAASAGTGGLLQYPTGIDDWIHFAANGNVNQESVSLILYGEGEAGPGGNPGEWAIFDFGDLEANDAFLTNDGDGIENWLFRTIDISQSDGNFPSQLTSFPGEWTGFRTDWSAFGTGTGIQEIGIITLAEWSCQAIYGSVEDQDIAGYIQFSKYPRDTTDVTFDSADVNTGADTITITGHPFSVGDQAVYIVPNGETGISGTDGSDTSIVDNEFVSIRVVDSNTIQLGTNLSSVDDTPNVFNLTGAGTGTGHILRRINVATPAVGVEGVNNELRLGASV